MTERKYLRGKSSDSLLRVNTIHPSTDDNEGKYKQNHLLYIMKKSFQEK